MEKGEQLPLFRVTDVTGREHTYAELWQRTALLLAVVPEGDPDTYQAQVSARLREIHSYDAVAIVTATPIAGVTAPGALIADRWGEVQFVASPPTPMPVLDDLVAWLKYVQQRCPECEGEAR